jgi:hypothetical protein
MDLLQDANHTSTHRAFVPVAFIGCLLQDLRITAAVAVAVIERAATSTIFQPFNSKVSRRPFLP